MGVLDEGVANGRHYKERIAVICQVDVLNKGIHEEGEVKDDPEVLSLSHWGCWYHCPRQNQDGTSLGEIVFFL